MAKYTIRLNVNVHGWEESVDVDVEAEDRGEACRRLGEALTRLVSDMPKSTEGDG